MEKKKPIKKRKVKVKGSLLKINNDLWADIVKFRAGYKSEYSGKPGKQIDQDGDTLNAHHIYGKSSYELRFNIFNGVSITNGEHFFIAHIQGRQEGFNARIHEVRQNLDQEIEAEKENLKGKSLFEINIYLNDIYQNMVKNKRDYLFK